MASGGSPEAYQTYQNTQRGSYVLRKLVEEVPLSAHGEAQEAQITCVELCG